MRSLLLRAIDRWLAPAPDLTKVSWLGKWDYAHRGLHGQHDGQKRVENSVAAFEAAIEAGMGIECDIQRSRDHSPMVLHDWDLLRLTGNASATDGLTAEELREVRYIDSEDRIISLGGLLELVDGRAPILIEIKSRRGYDVQRTCEIVRDYLRGYTGQFAVMSFDPRVSRWLSREMPDAVRGLVMKHKDFPQWYGYAIRRLSLWYAKPDFLAHDIRDLPTGLPSAQRARGMPVVSWTVRSPELRARAAIHADAPIAEGEGVV
ncbi:glycerophosphodiester phosphodiesterase family protein [Sphingomonadaceae bacterium]|nr:glycerophosphodiester phosphodiesterase family protein [Sphingomonadaceae bacterium]